ncbi:MAG TPA: glutamine amidotransferase [Ideonella sp.]|nr:glutamine amidotransferase [Ideonella sp.]
MHCLVIQHLAFEDLGSFAPVLRQHGYRLDIRQAGVQPVSADEWATADLVVVLGGPIGVGDVGGYPWLADQIVQLGRRLQQRRPVLGVCLGAQLIAAALGARVHPAGAKEIGWAPLQLTPQGQHSPLRHLAQTPVLHWHGDTFELPPGAELLAATGLTPHQAFGIGRHALALQFHAEVDPAAMEAWLIGHTLELHLAGVDLAALRAATAQHGAAAAQAGAALLGEWLSALDGAG